MNALAHVRRGRLRNIDEPAARAAIADMTYELVPLKTLEAQIDHLPEGAHVSVTASPVKTLEDTLDICARLADAGHRPVPHLAARMVDDADHVRAIARRMREVGLREAFCIAGDHEHPRGYPDAMSFLRDFLEVADVEAVGVASYPDGHAFIDDDVLLRALHDKQELLVSAGVAPHMSTQMCFSPDTIRSWLDGVRAAGVTMPVHLGVPGVVDRTRLMTMGLRLGVGTSLRYLQKNRGGIARLFATAGYNPGTLIEPLAGDFEQLGIEGLHVFTFNQVEATRDWQRLTLG